MKASELFVKCLENEGVKFIFGVPGEENADFLMALDKSSISFVLTRHEQGAAFMADVYGRLTGEAGVCLGTLGPGATNLVTGVADGNMDRAPMVVLTGQADVKRQHKESHQHMDVTGMYKPITKWSCSVLHPDNIPEIVRKAFKVATREKPGACHIELPEDIAAAETNVSEAISPQKLRRGVCDETVIENASALLKSAKRPIILAGNGAIRTRASAELRRFAERTGIGVVSTFMGKGAVDRDSEQCLFTVGLQAKDYVACEIEASDLVIAVGYDLVEYPPRLWNADLNKKILHVDFLPAEVDQNYPISVEAVGDIAYMLSQLTEKASEFPTYDLSPQQTVRSKMMQEIAAHKDDDTTGSIRPQKVLWDVREVLGPEDILLSDVGAHKMWVARYYACNEPNTCLISNGFCSMGFAFPGAMAASLVYPDRRVMAICGDGGFLMNLQEMETAKRIGSKLVVLVWEDKGYGLISWKQDNEFGRHTNLSFENPDFMKLASAFGWNGFHVTDSADLKETLESAFEKEGPSLVVIPIDYRENSLLTERLGDIACPI